MPNKRRDRRRHGSGSLKEKNGSVYIIFRPVPGKPQKWLKVCRVGELNDTAIERRAGELMAAYKPPEEGESVTVSEQAWRYVARLMEEGKAKSYIKNREGTIRTHLEDDPLGARDVKSIKPKDIRHMYSGLRRNGVEPATMVSVHWLLSGTFRTAVEDERRTDNPVAAVATPKYSTEDEIRPLTTEEVDRVIAAVPDDDLGRVERDLYRVAQHTGMRRGELLALQWMDCQFALDSFDISQNYVEGETKDTKGHLARTTPMTRTAKETLLARRKTCRFSDDEDLVFTLTGEPLNPGKVSKRFKAALLRAEVGPIEMKLYRTSRGKSKWKPFPLLKLHQLRDTFASHAMSNPRVAPVEVQNALGHRDLSTTSRRYGKYIPQADTAERFEASFNRPLSNLSQNSQQGAEKVAEEGTVNA